MERHELEDAVHEAIALRVANRTDDALELLLCLVESKSLGRLRGVVFGELGGLELYDMGRPEKALGYFDECVRCSPRSELASLGRFHSLFALHHHEEAVDEMRRFLSTADSPEYRRLLRELVQS